MNMEFNIQNGLDRGMTIAEIQQKLNVILALDILRVATTIKAADDQPVGLRPHVVWLEERLKEIEDAVGRYNKSNKQIPTEWTIELLELVKFLL